VNGHILRATLGIMILRCWMMTLMRFIKKKSCHPLSSSIMVQVGLGLAEDQPHAAEQPSGLGEDPSRNEMEFTEDPPQVL
jgi:hypothetical protein